MAEVIPHGSAEWHKARVGVWTASRAAALMDVRVVPPPTILTATGADPKKWTPQRKAVMEAVRQAGRIPRQEVERDVDGASAAVIDGLVKAGVLSEEADGSAPREVVPTARCKEAIVDIAVERATGREVEHFVTQAMRRGLELEPDALSAYTFATGHLLEGGGFVRHPSLPNVGASPDGFVIGAPGLVETKAPDTPSRHLATLVGGAVDGTVGAWLGERSIRAEYETQALWQLWCCPDREWVDLTSYDPRWPAHRCLARVRVERDEEAFARFAEQVEWAEERIDEILAVLPSLPDMLELAS